MPPPPWLKTKSDNIIKVLEQFQAFDPLRVPLTPWLPEGGREGGGAAARGRECGGASLVLNKEGDDRKTIKNKKIVTKKGERECARKSFAQD